MQEVGADEIAEIAHSSVSQVMNAQTSTVSSQLAATTTNVNIFSLDHREAFQHFMDIEQRYLMQRALPVCPLCGGAFASGIILQHLVSCCAFKQQLIAEFVTCGITDMSPPSKRRKIQPLDSEDEDIQGLFK